MFVHGGVSAIAGCAHMGGDALALVEDLDGALGDAGPKFLPHQGMGDGIVMLGDLDMVIETGAALFPFGVREGLGGQWSEGRLIKRFEQLPPLCAQMLCDAPVQRFQRFMDGLVQFGEGEETSIA